MKRVHGIDFVAVPQINVRGRGDLDAQCHYALREEVNTWLYLRSESDLEGPGASLRMEAVNPDGERRASHDFLCFWWPLSEARKVVDEYMTAPTGTPEFCMDVRQAARWSKRIRGAALTQWNEAKHSALARRVRANRAYEEQQDHLRRGC